MNLICGKHDTFYSNLRCGFVKLVKFFNFCLPIFFICVYNIFKSGALSFKSGAYEIILVGRFSSYLRYMLTQVNLDLQLQIFGNICILNCVKFIFSQSVRYQPQKCIFPFFRSYNLWIKLLTVTKQVANFKICIR